MIGEIFVIVVSAVSGGSIGASLASLRRRGPRAPEQPKPICGCKHHLAHHDPQTGACQSMVRTPTQWGRKGTYTGSDPLPTHYEYYPCSCKQYVGPRPADVFLAQEVNWDLARMQAQEKVVDDDG